MHATHLSLTLVRGAWLLVAAFLAGAINAMAGGGSFLSFPAMLGVGVAPIQANATNTVALWPGQAVSIFGFRRDIAGHTHLLLPVMLAGACGGTAGAIVLLRTGQGTFLRLVPWLLLVAASLFWASQPLGDWVQRRTSGTETVDRGPSPIPLFASLVVVCFYIGYFGAGAGFLMMAILGLFGVKNINEINGLKVVGTTLANGAAVITFIVRGAVVWRHCLIAMLMAAAGGFVGAKLARRMDESVLRIFVVVLGFAMAGYFFWRLT